MQWNLKNNNVLIPIVRFGVNKRIQGSREKVHVDSDQLIAQSLAALEICSHEKKDCAVKR